METSTTRKKKEEMQQRVLGLHESSWVTQLLALVSEHASAEKETAQKKKPSQ